MPDSPLRSRLRAALTAAMKARDTVAVTALRTTLAAIDNAGAVATVAAAQVIATPARSSKRRASRTLRHLKLACPGGPRKPFNG